MRKHYSFKDYLSTQTPAFRKKLRKEVAKLKKNHEMITEFDNIVCQLQDIWDKLYKDTDLKKYMKEQKIRRPVGWDGK